MASGWENGISALVDPLSSLVAITPQWFSKFQPPTSVYPSVGDRYGLGYVVAIYAVAVLPGVVIAIAIAMTAEQLGVGGWGSGVIGEALMRSGMYVKTAMLLGYFYALSRESAMPLEPMAWLAELSRRDVHGRAA